MEEFLAALSIFTAVVVMMAIGVIIAKKPIKGSCGGLNNIDEDGDGTCSICGVSYADSECAQEDSKQA